jgi:hypothetical protein
MPPSASSPPPAPRSRTWTEEVTERATRALAAGGAYFLAIVFASWSFGPVREILAQRGASGFWPTLLEVALLLFLLALAAAAALRLFRVRDSAGDRLLVGGIAVTVLVAAELVGGPLVRDWGPYETLTGLMPEPSSLALFLALLVGAVLAPLIEPVGRANRRGQGGIS